MAAALIVSAWPVAAQAAWQEASSAHFIVYADDKPERIKAFTERLEKFDKALRLMRGVPDAKLADADRVRVYMVGDIDYIGRLAGKGMENAAGFYNARVGGPVAFVPRDAPRGSATDLSAQAILMHEYTHHFMFLNWVNYVFPAWFVEGFAEFNATADFKPDGSVTFGETPNYRAWAMGTEGELPAAKLLQLNPGRLTEHEMETLYGRGWLLTHYLTFEPSRAGQLGRYIRAINSGKNADQAASAFGDLKKLDRALDGYVMRGSLAVTNVPASALTIGAITLRPLNPGEAAVMPARIRSVRGVDKTDAADVAKLARKLSAPFPNDAGAQNELAEAEFDAGNLTEAEAAADRALAADPKSVHALIYKGRIRCAQLEKVSDNDPTRWRLARRWFVDANHVDPDNPEPLALFYQSFFQASARPNANAEDGELAAYADAPFDLGLRTNAAIIFLDRGDKDRARLALLPVAYSPHRGSGANPALDALTAIDAGKVDDALRLLQQRKSDTPPANGKSSGIARAGR